MNYEETEKAKFGIIDMCLRVVESQERTLKLLDTVIGPEPTGSDNEPLCDEASASRLAVLQERLRLIERNAKYILTRSERILQAVG
jgi:hypothetical protein